MEGLEQLRWQVGRRDREAEQRLSQEIGTSELVSALLIQRGYTEPEQARKFLKPSLNDLHDPSLLPDYELAQREILGALERKDLIYIHGDYDADGVTSTAILFRFLSRLGGNVQSHVPHRILEGYGIHPEAVDKAHATGAKLFLTCDCGISAFEQVERARALGMRVVVTDHHAVKPELPIAHAVVNPHRKDAKYPFEELCGAGVAFKLCAGLWRDKGNPEDKFYKRFADLATLGTIADMMPLVDENRVIAQYGLSRIAETDKHGLKALISISGLKGKLTTQFVNFQLVPRINAVGRVDDAMLAYRLLVSTDSEESMALAQTLDQHNQQRKQDQEQTVREALELVAASHRPEDYVIVVANEGWKPGLVGLAAGKVAEKFHRPAFILTRDPQSEKWKGSARSIPGFNLASAIQALGDILQGGGHSGAAGCSLDAKDLQEFQTRINRLAAETLKPEDLIPSVSVDLEAEAGELTEASLAELEQLQPFGRGNPEPSFMVRRITVASIRPMKNPIHVNLRLKTDEGKFVDAVSFGLGDLFSGFGANALVDLVVNPEINEYNGRSSFRWNVRAVRPAEF